MLALVNIFFDSIFKFFRKRGLTLYQHKRFAYFVLLVLLFIFSCYASLTFGFIHTTWGDVVDALTQFNNSQEHIVIIYSRIPRTVNAILTGGALGISGVMLQALTKNQLASASILGINSGASLFLVVPLLFLPNVSWSVLSLFAFVGALLTAILVYAISGGIGGKVSSKDLVLGGTAISTLFFSLTQALLYSNNAALEDVLYWMTGSVEGKKMEIITMIAPFIIIGFVVACFLHKGFTTFELGDEMASSLGMKVVEFKAIVLLVVSILCGASVALAGPVAFVCLVTPYIVKHFFGTKYQMMLPISILVGASMLIASDVLSRFILFPKELPVGAVTAFGGGAFFIYLFLKREKNHD